MKTLTNTVKRLEKKMPEPKDTQFVGWPHNPWTPEQMVEAARREPTRKVFWRTLVESPEETAKKMADPSATF